LTKQIFQEIFFRIQQGSATKQEVTQFLQAIDQSTEFQDYLKECLEKYFDGESADFLNDLDQLSAYQHRRLQQNFEQIEQRINQQTEQRIDQVAEREIDIQPLTAQHEQGNLMQSFRANPDCAADQVPPVTRHGIGKRLIYNSLKIAAVALFFIGTGIAIKYATQKQQSAPVTHTQHVIANNSIQPGRSAAILTLGNGQQITLDSNSQQNIRTNQQLIALSQDGRLQYKKDNQNSQTEIQYNTLTTQKGNRYQLILPDGTDVWLNAESSIRFPNRFAGDHRSVSITGEVYFEVAHDARRPFSVSVRGQLIKDIGTAFNVNAYDNEPSIKTTLIEGMVEVNNTRLAPGWQAAIQADGVLKINKQVDLAEITSWKNNLFLFHQTSMESILRQIERWYNVQIIYKGQLNQTFTGGISRQASLQEILQILSFSNKIKFEIHDRNITVQPN